MTFLVMDTSGEYAVLALSDETGALQAVNVFEGRRTLSRRLFGQLDALLKGNGLALNDLTGIAVGLGPGSFTGVRVGVTTAKTLAQVTGKPLVGIGTLDAYASGWNSNDNMSPIIPILPSRRGEVYAAVYQVGERTEGPFAATYDVIRQRIFALDKVILCGQPLMLTRWALTGWYGILMLNQPFVPPEGLARLASRRLASGDTDDPLGLVPFYVVAPSISTPKNPHTFAGEHGHG